MYNKKLNMFKTFGAIIFLVACSIEQIFCFPIDKKSDNTDSLSCSWEAYYKSEQILSKSYSIISDENVIFEKGYYFPEYTPFDTVLICGANPFVESQEETPVSALQHGQKIWQIDLSNKIITNKNNLSIYQRIYCTGISEYSIALYSLETKELFIKKFKVNYDGYQIPQKSYLKTWEKVKNSKDSTFALFDNLPDTLKISQIYVFYKGKNNNNEKFIIGDFYIADIQFLNMKAFHPFFADFLQNNALERQVQLNIDPFPRENILPGLSVLFGTETQYLSNHMGNSIYFKRINKHASEVELLKKMMNKILNNYPFYNERGLNKQDILEKYTQILRNLKDTTKIISFAKMLEPFIKNFRDPHFSLFIPREDGKYLREVPAPIRTFGIDDKVYVAAIFDDSLKSYISLGDEILEVDNKNVQEIITERIKSQYGTPARQRSKAISQLLFKERNDSSIVTYIDSEKTNKNIKLFYNKFFEIPTNFKPIHCYFDLDKDSLAYFRINNWDNQVYLRFLNYAKTISGCKGLIIDIRGNHGGSTFGAIKLTSLFINKPLVYNEVIPYKDSFSKESLVIQPNAEIYLDLPVVLLGDENTSCASEDFILAMRRTGKAVFIGSEKTAGILAARHDFYLPSGITLFTNSVANKIVDRDFGVIECKGVEPDIYIKRNSVYDLYPYNDKILIEAKKYLLRFRLNKKSK